MYNKQVRNLLLLIGFILPPLQTWGQEKAPDLFHAGKDAVFINMGRFVVSTASPKNNVTAYRVDKTAAGKNKWATIIELEGPANAVEFRERLLKYNRYFPEPTPVEALPVDTVWRKISKNRDLNSLSTLAAYIPFRLALGTSYPDVDVSPGNSYEYRIYYKTGGNWVLKYTSDQVKYPASVNFAPLKLYKKFTTPSSIDITWVVGEGSKPGYYQVLRRDNFAGSFNPVKALKVLYVKHDSAFLNIQDGGIKANLPYEYMIVPFDLYGNAGKRSDTLVVSGDNIIEVARPAKIKTRNQKGIEGIIINWEVPDPKKTVSLKLFRSTDYDIGYELLTELSGADTMFVDQTALPMQKYYYYFTISGLLGEKSGQSAKVFGIYQSTLPVLPPIMVQAEPKPNGVRISWRPGDDHIRGYYVFRGDRNHLEQISNLQHDTVYMDTSKVLSGREVYAYSVVAEGLSYQRSTPSDTVFVHPSVNEMILSPTGMETRISDGKVKIFWDDMEVNDENIIAYIVYRRRGKEAWTQISNPAVEHNYYTDSLVQQGQVYQYTAKSVSITGKISPMGMAAAAIVPVADNILQPPSEIVAYKATGQVTLRWSGVSQSEIEGFRLYRSENGKPPVLIQSVDKNTYEIKDATIKSGVSYTYSISSFDKNKNESKSRTIVAVRL